MLSISIFPPKASNPPAHVMSSDTHPGRCLPHNLGNIERPWLDALVVLSIRLGRNIRSIPIFLPVRVLRSKSRQIRSIPVSKDTHTHNPLRISLSIGTHPLLYHPFFTLTSLNPSPIWNAIAISVTFCRISHGVQLTEYSCPYTRMLHTAPYV
jgi:hypothetical protein